MPPPPLPPAPPAQLLDLLQDGRALYLHLLELSLGTRETAGACLYASVLLCSTLNKFGGVRAVVRGGCGDFGGGGYTDHAGVCHGHYWVEARDAQQRGWVLDITADQFGGPATVALPLEFSAPRYVPGSQALVDRHVQQEFPDFKPT